MDRHGALVGWTHHDLGHRVMLNIESFESAGNLDNAPPDHFRLIMTKQQAAVLGNYLVELSGQTAANRSQRGWFKRMFG